MSGSRLIGRIVNFFMSSSRFRIFQSHGHHGGIFYEYQHYAVSHI